MEVIEFDGVDNIEEIKTSFSKTKLLICSGSGKHLKAYIYDKSIWKSPKVLPLGQTILGAEDKPYDEKTALCHDFEAVNDVFLSDCNHIYILAFPFVFIRYSINSGTVRSFELLENEALKNKVANAYKTNISKGHIMMNYKQDMVAITAVKRIGAKYM
jgi:hypothetical protein